MNHFRYFVYVLRHKWHVGFGCLLFRVPLWRAAKHDWSKFTAAEWGPYKRKFVDRRGSGDEFERAWLHHIHTNDHHWQHWVLDGKALEMPMVAVREMVADWYGAGLAINRRDDLVAWYAKQDGIDLHPATRMMVDDLISRHSRIVLTEAA